MIGESECNACHSYSYHVLLATGILQPLPKALSVTFSPGAA
jgi:hypothetical protein